MGIAKDKKINELWNDLSGVKAFSPHTFDKLMNNNEKRLSVLRGFAKRYLTKEVLYGKRVLEINATNITFANYIFNHDIESYTGLCFDPNILERLSNQLKIKGSKFSFDLLKNDVNFEKFSDYDVIISFGFIESLNHYEVFEFFKGSQDKMHMHSFMNKKPVLQDAFKRLFTTKFPVCHDKEIVFSAIGKDFDWNVLESKNFREHVIIRNF